MGLILFIVLVLSAPGPALGEQPIAVSKLEWAKQQRGESDPRQQAPLVYDGSSIVLPQPESPPVQTTEIGRGWRLKNPEVGTGSLVTTYEDKRTAIQIAQGQQESAMTRAAPPAPLLEDLPDEFQQFNLRLDFGVEFRF